MALYDSEAEKASLAEAAAGNSRPADSNTAGKSPRKRADNRKECVSNRDTLFFVYGGLQVRRNGYEVVR